MKSVKTLKQLKGSKIFFLLFFSQIKFHKLVIWIKQSDYWRSSELRSKTGLIIHIWSNLRLFTQNASSEGGKIVFSHFLFPFGTFWITFSFIHIIFPT